MQRLYLNTLFDYYKELLTEKEQNIFIDHYIEDLSLQEIADNLKITKSAVGKTLKIVEKKLNDYEEKLALNTKAIKINEILKNKIDEKTIEEINQYL